MATATLDLRTRDCFNCETRFRQTREGQTRCPSCEARSDNAVEAERARRRLATNGWRRDLLIAFHWRGYVVGMYEVEGANGDTRYRPRAINVRTGLVPKKKLVDLDQFCPQYTREMVVRFKGDIKHVHGLDQDPPRLPPAR